MSGLTSWLLISIPAKRRTDAPALMEAAFLAALFRPEAGNFRALAFEWGLSNKYGTLRDRELTALAFRRYIFFRPIPKGSMRTDPSYNVGQRP